MITRFLGTGRRRSFGGVSGDIFSVISAAFAVWVVYANIYALPDALLVGILFVSGIYTLLFLAVGGSNEASDRPGLIDWSLSAASTACGVYFFIIRDSLASHITLLYPLSGGQLFFGALLLFLTLEATRRTTGLGLTFVVLLFLGYNLWGHLIPPPLGHGYIDFSSFIDTLMYTTDGVFGVPIQVAASYVFLFVLFGSLLSKAGGAEFMFRLAAALTGKSPGGPAKIAIISSGMYGMISGSPTSDVATTGSVTIPVMKRLGYSARFAGAVEVAASTGGAAMPPVMGSAAFILAEYTGIDYRTVVVAALIPAILYYLGIYIQVHLRAVRRGMRGVDVTDPVLETLKAGWVFVLPLVVITAALLVGYTPTYVAVFGSAALLAASLLKPQTRMGPLALMRAIGETTMRMLPVAGACAAAGLVIGGLTMTGLSMKASGLVSLVADSGDLPLLMLGALITIILGLGMPTPSAYILAAVLVGPAFAAAELDALSANMFLLYFALLSALTPPIAVAAFAAAAIADEDAMKIAVTAVKLAATGFLLPFVFVWNPAFLAMGGLPMIALAVAGGLVAVFLLAHVLESEMRWLLRIPALAFAAAAVCPYPVLSLPVVLIAAAGGVWWWRTGALPFLAPVRPVGATRENI
ncbi:MAG: TRAP transporter fused permease subunit [Paracoccaceae bacterium]